jgi:hypothetical protein
LTTNAIPLRPAMDDRNVDVVRRAAQTTASHAVFVSMGSLREEDLDAFLSNLPHPFDKRLCRGPDALELYDDLESAEGVLEEVRESLDLVPMGHAAHGLLARRDGIVLLALPGSTSMVCSTPFPGFADADD